MKTNYPQLITALALILLLAACSKQGWYAGAQSAQQAQCMKGPAAEYEDCMRQSTQGFDEYNKNREQLLRENQGN